MTGCCSVERSVTMPTIFPDHQGLEKRSFRAIKVVLGDVEPEELALVSVHGTSTAYNDEMESIALTRAGLQNVPVNSLKGYFGHTMGAAGILETILSMASVDDGLCLGHVDIQNAESLVRWTSLQSRGRPRNGRSPSCCQDSEAAMPPGYS